MVLCECSHVGSKCWPWPEAAIKHGAKFSSSFPCQPFLLMIHYNMNIHKQTVQVLCSNYGDTYFACFCATPITTGRDGMLLTWACLCFATVSWTTISFFPWKSQQFLDTSTCTMVFFHLKIFRTPSYYKCKCIFFNCWQVDKYKQTPSSLKFHIKHSGNKFQCEKMSQSQTVSM